jgi:hypothetical protein
MHPIVAKAVKWSAWTVVAVLVAAALFVLAAYHWDYSNGDRAGFVQKFANKGWICKTWEGELAMVNLPGQMAELFPFTVRDDAVAAEVNAALGKRVVLTYEEHRGLPGSCFGDTAYFVTAVRVVEAGAP